MEGSDIRTNREDGRERGREREVEIENRNTVSKTQNDRKFTDLYCSSSSPLSVSSTIGNVTLSDNPPSGSKVNKSLRLPSEEAEGSVFTVEETAGRET